MMTRPTQARLRTRVAAILVALGGTLLVVEVTLWFAYPTPYHEWMEWQPDGHIAGRGRPGISFKTGEGFEVRINKLGFRGPDPTWQPPPATLRVVALGGSSTFNYHAQGEAETWPGFLESLLAGELGLRVQVVNLAIPGFSSVHSKINYLVTGRQLAPHVAILYHTWNDLKYLRALEADPLRIVFSGVAAEKPSWQRFARKFQIPRLLRNIWFRWSRERQENYYTSMEETGGRANRKPSSSAFAWAAQNFEDFARFVNGDGALPVLVSQATLAAEENLGDPRYRLAIHNDYVGMTLPVLKDSWLEMRDLMKKVAAYEGAIFVDGYSAVPHDFQHLKDHVHLTAQGTRRLARAITSALLAAPEFNALVEGIRNRSEQAQPTD